MAQLTASAKKTFPGFGGKKAKVEHVKRAQDAVVRRKRKDTYPGVKTRPPTIKELGSAPRTTIGQMYAGGK